VWSSFVLGLCWPSVALKTYFVDTMLLNIFYDLPISQNQFLKLADDCYIRILKNKMKSFGILN
jgi:hypothetical protein